MGGIFNTTTKMKNRFLFIYNHRLYIYLCVNKIFKNILTDKKLYDIIYTDIDMICIL